MKLKEARKNKKLTQKELAALSGVPLRSIQDYESGARQIDGARLETLCDLALALGVGIADIIENETLIIKLGKAVKKAD